jgi:hypothetical protein
MQSTPDFRRDALLATHGKCRDSRVDRDAHATLPVCRLRKS